MNEERIPLKITVNGDEAAKSVGNIRKEIKQATIALQEAQSEFGDYSEQAITAAKRVAELRDKVAEAAETAKLFDPGAKFAAFSGAINAVAGGFAAVQGALGLVGVESEDLQKQLLKVQSALALSEGLSRITDSAKDFQRLFAVLGQITIVQKANAAANSLAAATMRLFGVATTTTSVSFKVLRAAIVSTGIGALVVVVGLLIDKLMSFKNSADEAAEAQANLNKELLDGKKASLEAIERFNAESNALEIARVKARGGTEEEIKKLERQGIQDRIRAQQDFYNSLTDLDNEEKTKAIDRIATLNNELQVFDLNAKAEELKRAQEAGKKKREDAKRQSEQAKEQQKQLEQEAQNELAQLTDENQKAITEITIENENERALKQLEIQLEQDKKRVNATKYSADLKEKIIAQIEEKARIERAKIQDKIDEEAQTKAAEIAKRVGEIRTEIEENNITDETERRLFAVRNKYAQEIAEVEKSEGDVSALVAALKERRQQEEDAIDLERREKQAEQRLTELEEIATNDQLDFEARQSAVDQLKELNQRYLDDKLISQEEYNKNIKQLAEAEIKIDTDKQAALTSNLNAYAQLLGQAANILGKNTVAGKAAAIAEATINTYLSASNAFRAMSKVYPAPFVGIAAAGLAVASGIKQVREIAKVQVPGIGGGGSAVPSISAPTAGGSLPMTNATAPLAPARPEAQVFSLDQQSIRGINSASQRAYVVESDITSAQERVTRLNRAARLG